MSTSNETQDHQQRSEERRFILWSIARANPGRGKHPWRSSEDGDVRANESSAFTAVWKRFSHTTYSSTKFFVVLASFLSTKAKNMDKRLWLSLLGLAGFFTYLLIQIWTAENAYLVEESIVRSLAEDCDFELGFAQGESKRGANVVAVRAPASGTLGFLGIRSFDRIVRLEIKRYEDVTESSLVSLEKLSHLERMVLGNRGPARFYINTNSELKKNWNRVLQIFKTMKTRQSQTMDLRPRSIEHGRFNPLYSA